MHKGLGKITTEQKQNNTKFKLANEHEKSHPTTTTTTERNIVRGVWINWRMKFPPDRTRNKKKKYKSIRITRKMCCCRGLEANIRRFAYYFCCRFAPLSSSAVTADTRKSCYTSLVRITSGRGIGFCLPRQIWSATIRHGKRTGTHTKPIKWSKVLCVHRWARADASSTTLSWNLIYCWCAHTDVDGCYNSLCRSVYRAHNSRK